MQQLKLNNIYKNGRASVLPVLVGISFAVVFTGLCDKSEKLTEAAPIQENGKCKEHSGKLIINNPILFESKDATKGKKVDVLDTAEVISCLTSNDTKKMVIETRIKAAIYGFNSARAPVNFAGYISSSAVGFSSIRLELPKNMLSGKWAYRERVRDGQTVIFFENRNEIAIQILEDTKCRKSDSGVQCDSYRPGNSAYFGGKYKVTGSGIEFIPDEYYGMNRNFKPSGIKLKARIINVWRCGTRSLCAPFPMRKERKTIF